MATSTSASGKCSGGCGSTTRFPSRAVPPHHILPVHTTTGLTLFGEVKNSECVEKSVAAAVASTPVMLAFLQVQSIQDEEAL